MAGVGKRDLTRTSARIAPHPRLPSPPVLRADSCLSEAVQTQNPTVTLHSLMVPSREGAGAPGHGKWPLSGHGQARDPEGICLGL